MRIPLSVLILFFISFLSCPAYADGPVAPPAPNESQVEGIVLEHAALSSSLVGVRPELKLYAVTVMVERSNALKGTDMLKDKTGTYIRFYSKEEIPPDIFGKKIKAKVTLRGDKIFWVSDIEAVK